MIDPINMTEYNASTHRLEEIALFSVLAANNNAFTAAKGLEKFLTKLRDDLKSHPIDEFRIKGKVGPFNLIRRWCKCHHDSMANIRYNLQQCGIGKHTTKGRAVVELAFSKLNLRTCSQEDLEKIHGLGLKTSRFFILHTRPEANNPDFVALDTHMLSHMRDEGYDVPKDTPSSESIYKKAANQFFELVKKSGQTLAEYDLMIWRKYSSRKRKKK